MPLGAIKCLLVDDLEANLIALKALLSRDADEILLAQSGQEALELLLSHEEVAIAIVDVRMPGMDGFELAELMRGVERTRHVPIIFLTAGTYDSEYRFRGYEAGAVDFLHKPIEPAVLRSKVDVFIELWRQRQSLARQRDDLRIIAEEKSRLVEELRASEERLRTLTHDLEETVAARTRALTVSQEQLRALAAELNLAEQRERKRLATELHDHLAQMLVLCRLRLGQNKRLTGPDADPRGLIRQTEEALDQALAYTRTLVAELSPPVLYEFGLMAALRWLAERMQRDGFEVTLQERGQAGEAPPEEQAVLLFQSVRELLMNAQKHAGCDRALVALSHHPGEIGLTIRDEGCGFDVSAANVAQGEESSRVSTVGFGLFSIRERMRAMGGTFDIESTVGGGTTARLVLPIVARTVPVALEHTQGNRAGGAERSAVTHASPVSESPPDAARGKVRVLLVDDHAMVRQGLRSLLEGYHDVEVVGEASNGEEAIDAVARLQPGVVVMDVSMPKMNGIEATAHIKRRHPNAVVIGLSVQATPETRADMVRAGAETLLTKEGAVEELYGAIQHAVGNRPQ
ncbi:hypothetical protein YTPLAS18_15690 [Nitrospira sp.]|nr:hypothetical protein YTPLAS18_15690 [Nitrospira sp.]